ncbi:MAG TPA: hypothetical protein VJC18_04745, partial [bacterium]|nr:hypothetical protein [bacterium]
LLTEHKLREKVFYAELDYDFFASNYQKQPRAYRPIGQLPSVYRDLSLVIPKEMTYTEVQTVIEKYRPELLGTYEIFDLFQGGNLGDDKKSLTLSMIYEPKGESLTDEQVNGVHFELVEKLKKELGVELR